MPQCTLWNFFTSTFNRFFHKIEIKKQCKNQRMFYLIPRTILSSKCNYSEVTPRKSPLPSFSFFFFDRENLQKLKKYSQNGYVVTTFGPSSLLCAPLCFRHNPPSPTLLFLPAYVLHRWSLMEFRKLILHNSFLVGCGNTV